MSLAQPYSARAIEVLVHVTEHISSDTARVMAADKLLDRGHGKPTQAVNLKAQMSFLDELKRTSAASAEALRCRQRADIRDLSVARFGSFWGEPVVGETGNGASGRVEDGRGSLGPMASAPFPIPAHQTERADFRHSAFRFASPQGPRLSAARCWRDGTPAHDASSPCGTSFH